MVEEIAYFEWNFYQSYVHISIPQTLYECKKEIHSEQMLEEVMDYE